jgi:hypothetical protein
MWRGAALVNDHPVEPLLVAAASKGLEDGPWACARCPAAEAGRSIANTMLASAAAVALLALIHLFGERLGFLRRVPRSGWLSAASGAAVAFVFVYLLPELSAGQELMEQVASVEWLEHHAYLIALAGFTIFYGLERLASKTVRRDASMSEGDQIRRHVFWVHVVWFGFYNLMVGYLLVLHGRAEDAIVLPFGVGVALHFVVNDHALREDHRELYEGPGRRLLAVAAGWLLGWLLPTPPGWRAATYALLTGGIILTVLKEELPEYRESRFWAFATGVVAYTGLLLLI